MQKLWQWLFPRPPSNLSSRRFHPAVEGLEERQVLSGDGLGAPVLVGAPTPSPQERLLNGVKNSSSDSGAHWVPGPKHELQHPQHHKHARERLLEALKNHRQELRSRQAAAWEDIIRGSTAGHHHRILRPKPKPPRLLLNRPPRRIKVPYLHSHGFDSGGSSEDNGTTNNPHIGFDDGAPKGGLPTPTPTPGG